VPQRALRLSSEDPTGGPSNLNLKLRPRGAQCPCCAAAVAGRTTLSAHLIDAQRGPLSGQDFTVTVVLVGVVAKECRVPPRGLTGSHRTESRRWPLKLYVHWHCTALHCTALHGARTAPAAACTVLVAVA
jgi:hypothetical protein